MEEWYIADPKIKKRAVQALLSEIRIFPKEGSPWERLLEIKGACLPLTPVNVASPKVPVDYHCCSEKLILSWKGLQ